MIDPVTGRVRSALFRDNQRGPDTQNGPRDDARRASILHPRLETTDTDAQKQPLSSTAATQFGSVSLTTCSLEGQNRDFVRRGLPGTGAGVSDFRPRWFLGGCL